MAEPSQARVQRTPQLTCELCRDRKVKCDKLEPCSSCLLAGVQCVSIHRPRLPRGRHAQRLSRALPSSVSSLTNASGRGNIAPGETNDELKERVRKLESLVQSLDSARTAIASSSIGSPSSKKEGLDDFWEDLVQEVEQLRDIIELKPGDADDEIVQTPAAPRTPSEAPGGGGLAVLGMPGPFSSSPDDWHLTLGYVPLYRNRATVRSLCEVYLRQVDPIIKILHRPSLSRWMIADERYLRYPEVHPTIHALEIAVCYAAVNSMSEVQCRTLLATTRSTALTDCREACEHAIGRTDLLTTRDITVLQAFVLYLIARGSGERNRSVWTLLATAVRTAKALHLHMDLSKNTNFSFYDVQMRKRLWLTICVLDMQTALAQASLPLVSADEVTASIASVRHINDSDFGPDTVHDIPDREGLTDITFALVKFHLQIMGRNIGAGRGMPSSTSSSQSDWEMLQHHAHKFEKSVLGLLHFCDPEASPYAWFTWHSTQLFVSGARLAALRPLYRTKWSAKNIPPRMRNDSELLELTTRALEKMELMHTDRRADDFRWMVTIQWHILAIAIAECYISSDRMLVRRAWIVIESLYQRHESFMTKNTGGSLQGPLGKLMRRTRDKIRVVLGDSLPENSQQATKFVATSTCLDPTATTVHRLESSESTPGSFVNLPTPLLREDIAFIPSTPPIPDADPWDQSWKLWEDFMCDISFDKLESSDGFI